MKSLFCILVLQKLILHWSSTVRNSVTFPIRIRTNTMYMYRVTHASVLYCYNHMKLVDNVYCLLTFMKITDSFVFIIS